MNLFIIFCIVISVISQIQPIQAVARPIMYVSWPTACLYYVLIFKGKLHLSKFTVYFAIIYSLFIFYCLTCYLFGAENLKSSYLNLLYIPLMFCFIGDCYSLYITSLRFERLCQIYVWIALLFAIWVHFNYFRSYGSWLNSMSYDFGQKNSAAQVWASAILINVFLIKYKSSLSRRLGLCITVYFLFLIFVSHCRAVLLGLALVFFYNIIVYSKHKILWIIIGLLTLPIGLTVSSFQNFINHSLLLTKYGNTDIDAFSSGRLGLYLLAWKDFFSSPLIGVGRYYVDCSYLSILTENGIIGFIMIESIWLYKIIIHFLSALKYKIYKNSNQFRFLISILIFYIVESFLEGFPPFGPGVSSMAFWLFTAILLRKNYYMQELE